MEIRVRRAVALASLLSIISISPSAGQEGASARIPLCPGLQIVTAVHQPNGDYESIKTVETVDAKTVRIKYSAEQIVLDVMAGDFGKIRKSTSYRTVRREDLQSATLYEQVYADGMPDSIPETTAIGTSAAVVSTLKAKGQAEFSISNAYSGGYPADRTKSPNIYDFMTPGTLTRVGTGVEGVSVIVNDAKVTLPAIRAEGDFGGERSEFFFLNDETNPITLRFRIGVDAVAPLIKEQLEQCDTMKNTVKDEPAFFYSLGCGRPQGGDRDELQVVKIIYRCSPPPDVAAPATVAAASAQAPTTLEQELAAGDKVEIYDIFFSFNSDVIREESKPRLAEIAQVLQKHPDWALSVGGHTDSVGGDTYNLDLSARRAAAVKNALVADYKIAASRLDTSGYGASQPRDTNETIAGRANNRRVELAKK